MSDNNGTEKCESTQMWVRQRLISGRVCFSFDDIRAISRLSQRSLIVALHRLKERKLITSPKKGFYVCIPDRYQLRRTVPVSFYVDDLMRWMKRDYYLGLTSSAAIWGAGHQRIQRDFAFITPPRLREGCLADGQLLLAYRDRMPVSHIVTRNADGGVVRLADAELTAFDLVRHANLCGGFSSVATVLAELLDVVDFERASDLPEVVPGVVWQRLGFLCEQILGRKDQSDKLYRIWKESGLRPLNVPLSPFETVREGPLNKRWHVRINLEPEVDDL